MTDIKKLERIASQVRRDIIRQTYHAQSGHPGGSLGCVELLVALYFEIMEHDPSFNMEGYNEDLFFLSNGHISPLWYSILAHSGYFPVEELSTFRKINSRLQGHPATHEGLPGVRVASGSLGQGVSVAIGAALAKKMNGDKKNVFVLTGDGELQEGQIWEACMFAPQKGVDNLIMINDRNGQQIDGPTKEVMDIGDVKKKWETFGWYVMEMDGNNMRDVVAKLQEAQAHCGKGKPVAIVMHTQMGYGVDYMLNDHNWHGNAPGEEQKDKALEQLEETLGDFEYNEDYQAPIPAH